MSDERPRGLVRVDDDRSATFVLGGWLERRITDREARESGHRTLWPLVEPTLMYAAAAKFPVHDQGGEHDA